MAECLTISAVVNEPGRLIEMAEARNVKHAGGELFAEFHYYGRLNRGPWVDLQPIGNRVPTEW